jgi:hypothetical protein
MKPVMVESRFLRHLTSFGTPGGAFLLSLAVAGDKAEVFSIGFPNENVRAAADDGADAGEGVGDDFALPKEKVRDPERGAGDGEGGCGSFDPFGAR